MKPTLRLDTGRDTFFASPYGKVNPLTSPLPGDDNLDDDFTSRSDRSRWQRAKRWINGKARGGSSRRLIVLGLFGLLWLGLYFYKQHVCSLLVDLCSSLGTRFNIWLSYIQHSTGIGCSRSSRYRRFFECFTARSHSEGTAGHMA